MWDRGKGSPPARSSRRTLVRWRTSLLASILHRVEVNECRISGQRVVGAFDSLVGEIFRW